MRPHLPYDQTELESRLARLTAREREVLVLVAEGLTNGEICRRLDRTAKTVDTHLSHLRRKLDVRDRVRLAWCAIKAGLVAVQRGPTGEAQGINRGLREELARRNLPQEALRQIDAAVTPVAGDEFLFALTSSLCAALHVDAAIVAETIDRNGHPHLAARAAIRNGSAVEVPPIDLRATLLGDLPPHQAANESEAKDDALAALVADGTRPPSLIGMLLHDADGTAIGAVAIANAGPIDERLEPELILRVYAGRVAAELIRLRSEAQLKASEVRFRMLAEHATDMISVHAPTGAYLYASPACEVLLGYRADELVGKSAYDLMDSRDIPKVGHTHHELLTRAGSARVRFQVRRKDGRSIWLETDTQPIRDSESGETIQLIAVSRDVTSEQEALDALAGARADLELRVERRTAELRNSERRWRSVCEYASEYICIVDEDLRIIYVNRTLPETTSEKVVGTLLTTYIDSTHGHAIDAMRAVLRTGQLRRVEVDSVTPSGRLHWATTLSPLVEDDRIVGVVCIGRDTTAERRIEAALRESERRYRLLFESSPEGLLVHDGEIVRLANERVAELLGYPDEASMVGVPILDLVQTEHHELVRARVKELLAGTILQPRMQQSLRRRDGSLAVLDVAARACIYEGRPAVQTSMRPALPESGIAPTPSIGANGLGH